MNLAGRENHANKAHRNDAICHFLLLMCLCVAGNGQEIDSLALTHL